MRVHVVFVVVVVCVVVRVVVMVVYGILCEDNMLIMSSESASDLSSGISRAINGFGDGPGESDDKKSSAVQRSCGRLMVCCGGG